MHQEDKREKEQNAVCLDSTFDLLVYYGMLKAEDAQCFRVEAKLESAAYLLASGALQVALLNTYVGNASKQYFVMSTTSHSKKRCWFRSRFRIRINRPNAATKTTSPVPTQALRVSPI